jgi:hypothetical protein
MTIRAFYAAIPPETFQELGANLLFSTTFSMINCPTHKSAQINGVKVALLVVLAKAIEASILASLKLADDYFHRLYGKPPEPLKWEIKTDNFSSQLVSDYLPTMAGVLGPSKNDVDRTHHQPPCHLVKKGLE